MISSLHLRHSPQYPCSSQQCSLLHHSNIVCYPYLFNPPIKFFCNTSNGSDYSRHDLYHFHFPQFQIPLLKSWHFSSFSFSFSLNVTSAGTAISVIIPFCSFWSITIMSGLLASITLSH